MENNRKAKSVDSLLTRRIIRTEHRAQFLGVSCLLVLAIWKLLKKYKGKLEAILIQHAGSPLGIIQ